MKVILLQDIRGTGKKGQMVEVADGYARNYLIPRKIAEAATADNINTMRMNDKAKLDREQRAREEAAEIARKLKDLELNVFCKGGGAGRLFGSVTNQEISDALKDAGITVDRKKIFIDEPIKTVGLYTVKCKLGYEINANLRINVQEKK